MNELINVGAHRIGSERLQTVNARDLHAFLEVGKDFSTWIKERIEQYGFVKNQDFVCSPIPGSKGRGGHNRRDYHLALDMAKELAMVERTEKGRQARRYFIECERIARSKMAGVDEAEHEPSSTRDRLPLLVGAAEIVVTYRLSFPRAYQALSWFAGVDKFPRMSKRQAGEVAAFVRRFLAGEATQRDFERIETNRAALSGESPQLELISMKIPLIYGRQ